MLGLLWKLVVVLCCVIAVANGEGWQKGNTTSRNWMSVAADNSGKNLVAVSYSSGPEGTGVYVSHDYGQNWQNTFINGCLVSDPWMAATMDSGGYTMYVIQSTGGLYTSRNGGSYWERTIIDLALMYPYYNSVATSADGGTVFVTQQTGSIYYSRNSGMSFSKASTPANLWWMNVASSASGQYAVALSADLYLTTNYGSSWQKTSAPSQNWYSAHFSGNYIFAAAAGNVYSNYAYGGVYISKDSGMTWSLSPSTDRSLNWRLVSADQTGQKVVAVVDGGDVYSSSDYGKTFTKATTTPSGETWRSITCDAQAQHLTLASYNKQGYIYYSTSGI